MRIKSVRRCIHVLYVTNRAIARMPAQISRAVGTIWVAGNRNPYVPRSRSSTVYAYFIEATPLAQSSDAPEKKTHLLWTWRDVKYRLISISLKFS